MSVRVLNRAALRRKLAALSKAAQGRTLERALTAGALVIQNAAKSRAPVRTGNLRRSIHIGGHTELARDYHGVTGEVGPGVPGPEHRGRASAVYIGTNVIYAKQREFGGTITAKNAPYLVWRDYDGGWHRARSVHQAATPYMRPAIDENGDQVRREIAQALATLLRATVR